MLGPRISTPLGPYNKRVAAQRLRAEASGVFRVEEGALIITNNSNQHDLWSALSILDLLDSCVEV